jgi:putative drug exporter of the RND superfamily
MLSWLAPAIVRRPRLVLAAALLLLAAAGIYGGGVVSSLVGGGFEDPSSESVQAGDVLDTTFGQGEPNLILLAEARSGSVDDPAAVSAGEALTARLDAEPNVEQAVSYWTLGKVRPLRSTDGDTAMVLARVDGDDPSEAAERASEIAETIVGDDGTLAVTAGGSAIVDEQISATVESDLARAEAIALPITLLLMVFVFGTIVAAVLPLAVGVFSVIGTFAVLQVIASITDVSIFALNLTTALGLGLAIDYSLFIVSRFREELAAGHHPRAAALRTIRTAGRTVVFSAATVAISLSAMLVFPMSFLRSFAYAGIAVALLAAVGSVVVLPALLAVLGPRVNKGRVLRRRPAPPVGTGVWHRVATFVMHRPIPIATAAIALLVFLGLPFFGIRFGTPDDRVLPAGDPAREVQDVLRADFTSREAGALEVVATGIGDPSTRRGDIEAYASTLSTIDGVARVDAATGSYVDGAEVAAPTSASARFVADDATWLAVVPAVEPLSPDGEAVVRDVRELASPLGDVQVGGPSAELVDSKDSLFSRLPFAAGIIAVTTFVVLFLMFGSLLVPLKAVVLNLLSLTATFGAMVWIFQDGNLSGLLDFTATGTIAVVMPILMFCIAFGLSMDYEVFLLSRIKEEHDNGADNVTSVAVGLERTGRLVTALAVLIAVVFVAFATSGVSFIKLFGVGLALAVLVDAFIIRSTLVPAFMRLAGNANWWAPAPLRRFHDRFGVREHAVLADDEQEAAWNEADNQRRRRVAESLVLPDGSPDGWPD